MNKTRMIFINAAIIGSVLLAIFFVRPAYLGYVTYQNIQETDYDLETYAENIEELKVDILTSNTNLSTCFDFNQILIEQLKLGSDKLEICNQQISNYAVSEEKYKSQIQDLDEKYESQLDELDQKYKTQIENLQNEIKQNENITNQYKNEYDLLVENLANKICCKMKIDNSQISFYKVENNYIICSQESGLDLSCSFE
ncbi:MAG: hypothetical protein IIC67_07450 [Thaumarchaeota archaeon]|nr:hypothetical protein [Nitrososphaerota archaeon]